MDGRAGRLALPQMEGFVVQIQQCWCGATVVVTERAIRFQPTLTPLGHPVQCVAISHFEQREADV